MKTTAQTLLGAWIAVSLVVAVSGRAQTSLAAPSAPKAEQAEEVRISQQQAQAILEELRAIRQLLERQRTAASNRPRGQPPPRERLQLLLPPGPALGRDDAPLTLVEFTDYQCPFCKRFQETTFLELKKRYIDTGQVRFVSLDLPLSFHAQARPAAVAARCAGEQDRYWEMRDSLIRNGSTLSTAKMAELAQALGLDMERYRVCVTSARHDSQLNRELALAGEVGVEGTPTFVLGRTGKGRMEGIRLVGAQELEAFESVIRQTLKEEPPGGSN